MDNEYKQHTYKSFVDLVRWEQSNLIEMVSLKCKDKIVIGRIHYLKKEFLPITTIPLSKVQTLKWSPQGKYLVIMEGNV